MTRAAAVKASSASSSRWNAAALWEYFNRSERPLTSLIFVTPLLLIYELGNRYFSGGVLAVAWVHDFLSFFGATGRYLPALAVVLILLCWHLARRDSWDVNPLHLAGMLLESLILAVPLLLICMVAATYLPMAAELEPMPGLLTRSIGAGVYEELVFRLGAFSLLSFVLVDLLKVKKARATIVMVVIASLAFSLYHYWGNEPFRVRTFVFRTVAGIYFGVVFAFRGFGISAGTHSAYDVIVHLLRAAS